MSAKVAEKQYHPRDTAWPVLRRADQDVESCQRMLADHEADYLLLLSHTRHLIPDKMQLLALVRELVDSGDLTPAGARHFDTMLAQEPA